MDEQNRYSKSDAFVTQIDIFVCVCVSVVQRATLTKISDSYSHTQYLKKKPTATFQAPDIRNAEIVARRMSSQNEELLLFCFLP